MLGDLVDRKHLQMIITLPDMKSPCMIGYHETANKIFSIYIF